MKGRISICIAMMCMMGACKSNEGPRNRVPKVLQGKSVSAEEISKRNNTDLVEGLYSEQVDTTPALKELEAQIAVMGKAQKDSTNPFNYYNSKNREYFGSAGRHLAQVKDSVLRMKLKNLLDSSLALYDSSVIEHTGLLKVIGDQQVTLKDLHTALKITRTIPVIEKYRRENLPALQSLQGFTQQQQQAIQLADTLIKQ